MSTEIYSREMIIDAIRQAKGKITLAARSIGCTRQTIYDYAKKFATVQNAIDESRNDFDEELLDVAEHKLRQAVLDGDRWAIRYALDKKGSKRGYIERKELAGDEDAPLTIRVIHDND